MQADTSFVLCQGLIDIEKPFSLLSFHSWFHSQLFRMLDDHWLREEKTQVEEGWLQLSAVP